MSHRPIHAKRVRRLRKALRVTPLAYIDLVQWLRDRGYAQTAGEARAIVLAGRIRDGSHTLGIERRIRLDKAGRPELQDVVAPVLAKHRDSIVVLDG